MKKVGLYMMLMVFSGLMACKKKPDPDGGNKSTAINFKIENVVDGQPLVLQAGVYKNEHGDTFRVTRYRYYISNISLETNEGTVYHETESYHLIDQAEPASRQFSFTGLPAGKYIRMKFLIGVDSLRNTSGAQTGALAVEHGMFWDWNSGYIMAMLEGSTPQAEPNDMYLHMAGFKAPTNVLRWVTLEFPSVAIVEPGKQPGIHIKSDLAEWFKTPHTIDLSEMSLVMGGVDAVKYADNYVDMFHVDHVD